MTKIKRTMSRPVGGLVRLTPRYSGRNSHEFWRRINALRGKDWDAAYSMGVALQNHEHTVLQFINAKKPKQTIEAGNSSPPPLGRTCILTSDQWACCNCRNRDYDGSCKLSGKQTSMTDYCAGYRQASF